MCFTSRPNKAASRFKRIQNKSCMCVTTNATANLGMSCQSYSAYSMTQSTGPDVSWIRWIDTHDLQYCTERTGRILQSSRLRTILWNLKLPLQKLKYRTSITSRELEKQDRALAKSRTYLKSVNGAS
jgi:hypothetical protein